MAAVTHFWMSRALRSAATTSCAVDERVELKLAWLESELILVPDAGNTALEAGIPGALVATTDMYARKAAA